jgi:two-component system chemotaxis response regulator CheB
MSLGSARPRREPPGPAASARTPQKVMVVDDSITARTVHSRIVTSDDEMSVVAIAGTAEQAIYLLGEVEVDVILLDLDMPGIGGLDALPGIIAAARGARIMVVSSLTVDGAELTLAALAQGAADTLPKPVSGTFNDEYRATLRAKVRALGMASGRKAPVKVVAPPVRAGSRRIPRVLAIGASTGGIHAIGQLFGGLPRRLALPILVTQHLPASFMPVFARQLQTLSGCETLVAEDDAELVPGRILVAPGDAHLTVWANGGRVRVRLDDSPSASGCTPSVDPMFTSLAEVYGADALGVILSGMGRDGAAGAASIVAAGGAVFAQDEASCAVWGMPRAIAEAGLACAILPPDQIGCRIAASLRSVAAK